LCLMGCGNVYFIYTEKSFIKNKARVIISFLNAYFFWIKITVRNLVFFIKTM
jgi:hypothetical protein